ncbi:MAG: histidine phosphatase family protein [Anaerolineae bacterium]|nr:histidine phosphatase family protein [Anaerolineae bacterium]
MRIYFARHGESQANLLHEISNRGLRYGLTRRGREQAVALAYRLQNLPIMCIYSSPVLRAIETSVILANRLDLDYEVVEALREYDCGIMEGRSDEEGWKMWQTLFDAWVVHQRWEQRIVGGESFYDIQNRFVPFIEGLVSQYGNTEAEVVCVSHGGVYWMMLPLVLKNVDNEFIAQYKFDYTCCIVAEWRPEGLYCVEWNGHVINQC